MLVMTCISGKRAGQPARDGIENANDRDGPAGFRSGILANVRVLDYRHNSFANGEKWVRFFISGKWRMHPANSTETIPMGRVGLEPTRVSPADFKSAAYANSATAPSYQRLQAC
jgi:hypothetical protein